MSNIRYIHLRDDVIDRLENQVAGQGMGSDQFITRLTTPGRIARAVTEALVRYVRVADPAVVPDLYQKVTLTKDSTFSGIDAFRYPSFAFTEREDQGLLVPIVDDEELEWIMAVTTGRLRFMQKSMSFGSGPAFFAFDRMKRRLFTLQDSKFEMIILRRPDTVFFIPENDMWHGVEISVEGTSESGEITLNDGTTEVSKTVVTAEPIINVKQGIANAVNASDAFKYRAWIYDEKLQLAQKYFGEINQKLTLTVDEGTTTLTVEATDVGTLELPVDSNYTHALAELTTSVLARAAARPPEPESPQQQGAE